MIKTEFQISEEIMDSLNNDNKVIVLKMQK